jgi:hypothetical protein
VSGQRDRQTLYDSEKSDGIILHLTKILILAHSKDGKQDPLFSLYFKEINI